MKENTVHTRVKDKDIQTVILDERSGVATCGLINECDRDGCDLRIKNRTASCIAFILDDSGRNPRCFNG